MQATIQQCNVCKAFNTTNALTWIRVFGVTLGKSTQPIHTFPRVQVDLCPTCAAAMTVAQLPGLYLPKPVTPTKS
jgi:hypothetical protein